jgi:hypothetical protein
MSVHWLASNYGPVDPVASEQNCSPESDLILLLLEPTSTSLGCYRFSQTLNGRNSMARDDHNKAAEQHENAAKSHRAAAEHHGKGDHAKGKEHSTNAQQHSQNARQHSEQAHAKSQQQK